MISVTFAKLLFASSITVSRCPYVSKALIEYLFISAFLTNKLYAVLPLKIILDISIKHIDTRDTYQYNFNTIFNGLCLKYKLNNELLHKYLPIIIKKDKEILESFVFLCSQEFSFDIMIKYFNKKSLGIIYDTNNNLSKENKEKLKQYLDQH